MLLDSRPRAAALHLEARPHPRRRWHAWVLSAALLGAIFPADAQVIGQWDFDRGLVATTGEDLQFRDGAVGETAGGTFFGTTESLGWPAIPDLLGGAAELMQFPAVGPTGGFQVNFNAAGNGSGSLLNQWTLLMDVAYRGTASRQLRALISTDRPLATPDADLFVGSSGAIGVEGRFDGRIGSNTWHRIGIVVDTGRDVIRKYVDGELVGQQPAGGVGAVDGRWALDPARGFLLFADDNGQTAVGAINSLQLRGEALTALQMRAFGPASVAGIPAVVPPLPSTVEAWTPGGEVASRDTPLGVRIHVGDTVIQEASVEFRLNGEVQVSRGIQRTNDLYFYDVLEVRVPNAGALVPGSRQVMEVSYTDNRLGRQTYRHEFTAAVFAEDFDALELLPNVDEPLTGEAVWTRTAPTGWVRDDTGVPGLNDPAQGTTEWKGWSFADKEWWIAAAGDQYRSLFTRGRGTIAVADPDEWEDKGDPVGTLGYFRTLLRTRSIPLDGLDLASLRLSFDSSWRPECCDDGPGRTNNQMAQVWVSYDGGALVPLLTWDSNPGSPTYHPMAGDETLWLRLAPPPGTAQMALVFGLQHAGDDWWWAIDNVVVQAGTAAPPVILVQPQSKTVSAGGAGDLSVVATNVGPMQYAWRRDGLAVAGVTNATLALDGVGLGQAGDYSVVVSGAGSAVTSRFARLEVVQLSITNQLVAHLKFNGTFADSSGRNNAGTGVGAVSFVPGVIGSALRFSTSEAGNAFAYVSLGTRSDFNFREATNFSIAFWTRFTNWVGDPVLLGNKDWMSGLTQGFVLATDSDGRLQWNLAGTPGARKDYDGPPGRLTDGLWHHVAVTFERRLQAVTYLDGRSVSVVPLDRSDNTLTTPPGLALNIGQDGTGRYAGDASIDNPAGITDGTLDDLGIWRRVLTAGEVERIYSQGRAGKDLSTASVPSPVPRITGIVLGPGGAAVTVQWAGEPGVSLQKSGTLAPAAWQAVPGTEGASSYVDPAPGATAFYRLIRP